MKTTLLLAMAAVSLSIDAFSQTQNRRDFFAEALQPRAAGTTTLISLKDSSYWHSSWNDATNDWGYTHRNIYHYNSFYEEDGNLSSNLAGNGWVHDENARYYLYDSNHRLLEMITENWTGSWNDYSKDIYTYDVAGNMLTKTEQVWFSGAWRNSYYSTYTYSGNNRTNELYQYWDTGSNSWVNMMRTTFTYSGNLRTSGTAESWNAGSWINDTRITNFVYAGTDLLSYEFEMWNSSLAMFELKTKTSYTYDINHRMLASALETWNAPTGTWEKILKADYSYDTHGNQIQMMEKSWDAALADWKNSSLIVHYYRTGYVGIDERWAEKNPLVLYPNPAADQITVSASGNEKSSTVSIKDLSGKTVLTYEPNQPGLFTMDIGVLEAGMYFLEVKYEQGSLNGKFIKN